jgi:DNA-binding Lrp family transcriptional regulator
MNDYILDEKDRKIIQALKDNSRMSIRKIADRTNIRPSTVHNKIRRLVDDEIIEKFTIKLNDEKIGENFNVFMFVSGSLEKYLDKETQENRCVREAYGLTGEYDLLLKLKFRDMKDFNKFIIDFRDKYHEHITKTLTMVQTIKLKEA